MIFIQADCSFWISEKIVKWLSIRMRKADAQNKLPVGWLPKNNTMIKFNNRDNNNRNY